MKMTYSWIIYSCLVFGSGILCDRKLEKRQPVSSFFVNAEDKFNCSNGDSLVKSWVCDGLMDCSDASDEINELCARNDYGTNINIDCGKVYTNQVLINNGQKALYETAPWNVGVYKKISDYEFICGGSIISSNLIVTAVHCFWKTGRTSNRILMDDGLYKIAVGKYDRNITIIDNNSTQIINVEIVYLKESYNGFRGSYGRYSDDIAIIVLKNRVSFSKSVAPVCMDWNGQYNEVDGDQGKIVGWGEMENGMQSPILLEASLRYINRTSCRDLYTNGFESYVTFDKFCAGSALGQRLIIKYGGAGLSFFHSNSYYLTGFSNCMDRNQNNTVFTDVKYHIQWIRVLYNRYIHQAASSYSVNAEDKFNCSKYGESIEKSWVCDGLKDCSNGSDESSKLCALNENGTNMTSGTK